MKRVPLICSPTPVHRLDRLSAELRADLWIKRDDLTGFALGGNKGRKLEFILGAALEAGADCVVTCGAAQSNFIRQLGAACAVVGLRCVAVAMPLPYDTTEAHGGLVDTGGNVLLDALFGVELRHMPNGTWDALYAEADAVADSLESEGRRVYRVPVGGSSPLGAYAFVLAGLELSNQTGEFDTIVFASSSGSTHVGLATFYRGSSTRVLGVACDPEPDIADDFARLSTALTGLRGAADDNLRDKLAEPLDRSAFELDFGHVGPGYGVPSEAGDEAIVRLARAEGIVLDPIYSGKAFGALLDLVGQRAVGGRICFWHTGGVPTVFARGA